MCENEQNSCISFGWREDFLKQIFGICFLRVLYKLCNTRTTRYTGWFKTR